VQVVVVANFQKRKLFNHGVKPLHHRQNVRLTHSIISEHETNHNAQPLFLRWLIFHGLSGEEVVLVVNFQTRQLFNHEVKPPHQHQKVRFAHSIISEHATSNQAQPFVS
jgi:hypothetical protein